ncbi:envelope glycoprotein [Harp seal herpesvirus]|uniref:Packaging protein UL32 n=1 Tax=phocid gammaherpesvirus 3 TaxID=2560643 RepID=A0A0R5Z8Y0_9GAMA|nr:envelope glycoprotein [Harp seal herpesvirus]AJG42995.1 envelope glycoprotein [Harp seal herpesvirus]
MTDFTPWMTHTISKHAANLQSLLENSFQPGEPETALNSPVLINTHNSLSGCSSCKVCQLIYSLINKYSPTIQFYEDYACLCFYTLHAPKSWSSTFMTAADLVELLCLHFPQWDGISTIYTPGSILGVDLTLHFFVKKCFKTINPDTLLDVANLNFLRIEFMKGCLTGSVPNLLCFKTVWHSLRSTSAGDAVCNPCCSTIKCSKKTLMQDKEKPLPEKLDTVFNNSTLQTKHGFLHIVLGVWSESALLSEKNKELALTNCPQLFTSPVDGDINQGPCFLSQTMQLKSQGHTSSVCLLCECLASHPEAGASFQLLKQNIMTSVENNIQLLDRIQFILQEESSMGYISNKFLLQIIKGCSPQEIHKHFFCDPRCILNTAITSPQILFKIPNLENLKKLKAALAIGTHLDTNNLFDCENLDTLVTLFKAIQVCKVGKTTFLEIIKELNSSLKRHNLLAIHTFHTSQIYT